MNSLKFLGGSALALGLVLARGADAQNLLVNTGFDGSLAGWQTDHGSYSTDDATGSPASGSVRIETTPAATSGVTQCVNLPAGIEFLAAGTAYHLAKGQSRGNISFRMRFHAGPNCGGAETLRIRDAEIKILDAWGATRKTVIVPAGSQSVEFSAILYQVDPREAPIVGNYDNLVLEASSSLLLAGGRFQIDVSWETATGAKGYGHAVQLTTDSGYFWFFDAANVEMIVKVLDGCALNDNRWVFAGGLTDVKVIMDVLDTVGHYERTYSNPQGKPFQPLQDTKAIPTCSIP